jgi:ankyrin repeat protein
VLVVICASCAVGVAPSSTALRDDPHGHLVYAARMGDVASIRALAAAGVDLDASAPTSIVFVFPDLDHKSWTALKHAVARHQADAVRVLLEWGAAPDGREAGSAITPLYIAAGDEDQSIAHLLLDAGADVRLTRQAQAEDGPGGPPARIAARLLDPVLGEARMRERRLGNLARMQAGDATGR